MTSDKPTNDAHVAAISGAIFGHMLRAMEQGFDDLDELMKSFALGAGFTELDPLETLI